MSMYTRAMLNAWLKDIILVNHPGTKELASDGGIVLLTSPDAVSLHRNFRHRHANPGKYDTFCGI